MDITAILCNNGKVSPKFRQTNFLFKTKNLAFILFSAAAVYIDFFPRILEHGLFLIIL